MATTAPAPKSAKKSKGFTGIKSGLLVIFISWIIAEVIYVCVFGYKSHFTDGDTWAKAPFSLFNDGDHQPVTGDLLGTIYKGGFIVPLIWTQLITVLILIVERFLAIRTAYGKGRLPKFVQAVKDALAQNNLDKAQQLCDRQRGSVGNVVSATLKTYREVEADTTLSKEQKVLAIQKTLEEATALEMPMLQENLPIIGTIVTLGTLTGLLGTVMGMIKSFSAMGAGDGGADSAALSVGISEALVNTASGIATGASAVISYNYFTNKIDRLTFSLDEVGFSIVSTFNATH